MTNVIPFRTRAQLEEDKHEKIKKDWEEYLELERKFANYAKDESEYVFEVEYNPNAEYAEDECDNEFEYEDDL